MNTAAKQGVAYRLSMVSTVSFICILLLLPLHAFLSTWLGTSIGPLLLWKSWKEIVLALLIPVIALYCFRRPDSTKLLWARWVNKVILLYVILHLLLTIFSTASNEAVIAGLLMNLRFLAMFVLAQFIVAADYPYIARLKSWIPVWLLWTMITLSILAILQVTIIPKHFLDAFGYNKDTTIAPLTLVDNNPDALRAFATMRGPNTLGAYLLIPLAFAFYFIIKKQRLILAGTALFLGLIALELTGSRSAWIGCIVMFGTLALLLLPREMLKVWARRALLPGILLIALLAAAAVTIPSVRLAIFHSGANRASLIQGSTEDHWLATFNGIKDIIANPFGTGPGSAGPASFYNKNGQARISEDYFVQIGQEVGIIGLVLFLVINVLVAKWLFEAKTTLATLLLASFIGLSVVNIFLHGWADDPTAMTWWGLAGLAMAKSQPDPTFVIRIRTSVRSFFQRFSTTSV